MVYYYIVCRVPHDTATFNYHYPNHSFRLSCCRLVACKMKCTLYMALFHFIANPPPPLLRNCLIFRVSRVLTLISIHSKCLCNTYKFYSFYASEDIYIRHVHNGHFIDCVGSQICCVVVIQLFLTPLCHRNIFGVFLCVCVFWRGVMQECHDTNTWTIFIAIPCARKCLEFLQICIDHMIRITRGMCGCTCNVHAEHLINAT